MLETPSIRRYSCSKLRAGSLPVVLHDEESAVTIRSVRTISRKGSSMAELNVKRIPPEVGYYLAGFADGEGSFNVVFRKRRDYAMPWKISLCFNVSQRDQVILALFKRHLNCGTLRSRPDGVWYFEVNNFTAITENVIPFFSRFGFLSAKKKRDFSKFRQIASLIAEGGHLHEEGIRKILDIRSDMNDGGKRTHSDEVVLETFRKGKSSETTRQAP